MKKPMSLSDIHVMQVGIFCNDSTNARLIVSTSKRTCKSYAGSLEETGSESIVDRLHSLDEFGEKDREAIFRVYDPSSEYKGEESWFDLMEKHNGNLGRRDRIICFSSYKDTDNIRQLYFSEDGAVFLQDWAKMSETHKDKLNAKDSISKDNAVPVNVSKPKSNEARAFEKAQREAELQELSWYTDNDRRLAGDKVFGADNFESVGFDPSHFG